MRRPLPALLPRCARLRLTGCALVLAAGCAAVLFTGCAVVDYEQRRWIFMPNGQDWQPPRPPEPGVEDVWIEHVSQHPEQRGETVRLHALWLPQPDERDAPALLFLHGVRWDVHASLPRLRHWHALGFSVLAVDYRGFGRSSDGMPSETLVAEDARAAWDWLAREQPAARRYIAGHSLGAVIAVRLAQQAGDESGLVVDGGFTSALDVLRSTRWGWLPVEPLLTQHLDAGARIAQVGSPVLVVHGSDDTMVAPQLGRALYERALPPKRFVLVDGAVHETTHVVGVAAYRQAVAALFGVVPP